MFEVASCYHAPCQDNYMRVAMAVRILSHRFDVIMFHGGFPKRRKDAAPKVRSDLGSMGFYFSFFLTTKPLRVMPCSLLLRVIVFCTKLPIFKKGVVPQNS